MKLPSWQLKLRPATRVRTRANRAWKPRPSRLLLEQLEDRLAPATVQFGFGSETVAASVGTFSIPVTSTAPATATVSTFQSGLVGAEGMAFDAAGNLYISENFIPEIAKVTPAGAVSAFTTFTSGVVGPQYLAFDSAGNLYVSDNNTSAIEKVTQAGVGSTFVSGFTAPKGVAFDSAGNLYVADISNGTVYKVTPAGTKSVFAQGLSSPEALAFDGAGNLYVSNVQAGTVTQVSSAGVVNATPFASGLSGPIDLSFDGAGNLYVCQASGAIAKVTPAGVASTLVSGLGNLGGMAYNSLDGNLYVNVAGQGMGNGVVDKITLPTATSIPFTLSGTAFAGVDYSNVTTSPLVLPAGQTSGVITGTILAHSGANPTLTITLGTPTGATLGTPSVNTLTINETAGAPTVTPSNASVTVNATSMTINGFGFSTTPANNVVTFSGGVTGTVTAATATQLTVSSVTGLVVGELDASVTVNGVSSGAAVQVANVAPVVTSSAGNVAANAATLTISGQGFSTNAASNIVTFVGGATGTVLAATSTQLTVGSLSGLVAGALSASVSVNGISSGTAVQVATVSPTVTASTADYAVNGSTLVINGFGFSSNVGNNFATFDDGVTGWSLFGATSTQLMFSSLTNIKIGFLHVTITSNGISSGTPVQVATVTSATPTVQFSASSETINESVGSFSLPVTVSGSTSIVRPFVGGFSIPLGVAVDSTGNIYVARGGTASIEKFTPAGAETTFAAAFDSTRGLAFDSTGNLYVAGFSSVYKVTPAGSVSTLVSGFFGINGLAFDSQDNLYLTTDGSATIFQVTPAGVLSNFAVATNSPLGLAFDTAGNLYVAARQAVNKITPAGVVTNFATGFSFAEGLAFDGAGNLYVSDGNTNTINKVTPAGVVSTYASGFSSPEYMAFDADGNLYVSNTGTNAIFKVSPPIAISVPFTIQGNALLDVDYTAVTPSPLIIPAGQSSAAITGTLLPDPGPNKTLFFSLQSSSTAALGSRTFNNLTINESSTAATVTSSTANLPITATSLVINGFGFSANPADNVVTFSNLGGAVTGVVTAATTHQLTVSNLTGLALGALNASVSVNGVTSGTPVQVATISPVVTSSTSDLGINATSLVINGFGFSANPADDAVFLSVGSGVVTAATPTQLTVTGLFGLGAGPLGASVTVKGISSGAPVQVASIKPVVTSSTFNIAPNATTLVINGFGFSVNPANDSVSFSNGVTGTVTGATANQLTIGSLSGLVLGELDATVTVSGVSSSTVQVGTVVPNWAGDIRVNTMWANTVVQNIVGGLRIDPGVTLTIQAGTVVQFAVGTSLTVDGTLIAQGTANSKILFTSVNDKSASGGANAANKGDWGSILFNSDSTASVLANVQVTYGGLGAAGEVVVNGAPLTATNCVFANSSSAGVRVLQASPTLASDTFQNNSDAAISMDLASSPVITAPTLTNNHINAVALDGGAVPASISWNNPAIAYWLLNQVTVAQGTTLTVSAGQIVKSNSASLIVNGTLLVQGTAAQPAIFTSSVDDASGGDANNDGPSTGGSFGWGGIQFNSTSTSSQLSNARVFFAGTDITVNGAPLTISDSTIGNANVGVRIVGASPVLSADTFQNTSFAAISMDLASEPAITTPTLTNNNINGVALDGGALSGSISWNNPAIVYWLNGSVTVTQGSTLTIAAGQIIKARDTGLTVNGTLKAQGLAAAPIVFTSFEDDATGGNTQNDATGAAIGKNGDWIGITFGNSSINNQLDFVSVLYAGGASSSAAVVDNGAPLMMNHGVIAYSKTAGMRMVGASPTLASDTFANNTGAAISMDLASAPTITNPNVINHNGINAVVLDAGSLPGNVTWNNPGIVYWLPGTVTVPMGNTLTIGAGQIIKAAPGVNGLLIVNGTLSAMGTAASPIIFTSYEDDSTGGNTQNDGTGTATGKNGDWGSITFAATSTNNNLDFVNVLYGGGLGASAAVIDSSVPLIMNDGLIANSAGPGIRIVGASPTLASDTFRNNAGAAISMDLASTPTITNPSVLNHNGINAVVLDGGSLPGNATWNNPGIVYWLPSTLTVPQGKTLTIAPGQIIKVAAGSNGSLVNLVVNGTLMAQGTAAAPIVFTSSKDDATGGHTGNDATGASTGTNGDWGNIQFASTSTANVLNNAKVLFGGGVFGSAAVIDNGAPLVFNNSVISNSGSAGLRIIAANPTMLGDTFLNNTNGPAVSMDLASAPVISGFSASKNQVNGLALDGGTLPGNASWNNPGVVYNLAGTVTVPVGCTLTVAAGQVVKAFGDSLVVNGTLLAQGTADLPISFTSLFDDAHGGDTDGFTSDVFPARKGDWAGIQFSSTSTANQLDYVNVLFGGYGSLAAVSDTGAPLAFTNGVIESSAATGLQVVGANVTLSGDSFQNNAGSAVSFDPASNLIESNLTFSQNIINGLAIVRGTLPGSTTWSYPGAVLVLSGTVTVPVGATLTVAPGQIIKVNNLDLSTGVYGNTPLLVHGRLLAQGTSLQPIVFTSRADDSAGGDTNNNGASSGRPNDWPAIVFSATSTGNIIDHANIGYGYQPDDNNLGMIAVEGGSLTVTNSILHDSAHDAVFYAANSTGTMSNNLVINNISGLQAEAGANVAVINNTIDGNHFQGVILDSPTITLMNNLITNSGSNGIVSTGPTNLTMAFNDVYNPGSTNFNGLADQTGQNGNLSADPKYFNQPGGQLQLRPGSPAEDAGTSAGAPSIDYLGNPRFKDPNLNGRGDGSGYDMGALEVGQIATSSVDLATTVVTGPATGLEGQQVTVNWTVQDVGSDVATGSWHDAVYLSASPVLTPDAILLGQVQHTGNVGPGQSYNASGSFTLPAVTPGNYYFLVRTNSQNEVFEAANLGNNTAASSAVAMDLPALTLGTPLNGSISATGLAQLYKVTTAAGGNLKVSLTGNNGGSNELYVSFGQAPTRQAFDARSNQLNSANQALSLTNVRAGTYYVLVYGANVPNGENFTLTATAPVFSITGVSPKQGTNTGQVTLTINGAQFDSKAQPQLKDSAGTIIMPLGVFFSNSGLISATFDLSGHPTGPATVQVVNPGNATVSLTSGFSIIAGAQGNLQTSIYVPGSVRVGRVIPITINYANIGNADLLAPIIRVQATSPFKLSLDNAMDAAASELDLIAINPSGPAGVLPAGASGTLIVYASAQTSAGTGTFTLTQDVYPPGTINWAQLGPQMRPAGISDAAWNSLFAQLQTNIGSTWLSYQQTISKDATNYRAGVNSWGASVNYSLRSIFGMEIDKASAQLNPSVSGQAFLGDGAHVLAGATLTLVNQATNAGYYATTRNDGTFVFPVLTAGTYSLESIDYVLPTPVSVTVGSKGVTLPNQILLPGASLSGGVRSSPSGAPLANIVITAQTASGAAYSTSTDANGKFTLTGMAAGTYSLSTQSNQFVEAEQDNITLTTGQQISGLQFALQAGATLSGKLLGLPANVPAGALISAIDANGTVDGTAVPQSNGSYAINSLPAGTYTIDVGIPGFARLSSAPTIVSTGQQVSVPDLTLVPGGILKGTITLPAGASFADLPTVSLTSGATGSISNASVSPSGTFELDNLVAGSYTLNARITGFVPITIPVTITSGQTTTVPLSPSVGGTISGTVTDPANHPVADADVTLVDSHGNSIDVLTDANGNYRFPTLAFGTYGVFLGSVSTPIGTAAKITISSAAPQGTANFTSPATFTISGTVFASDGQTEINMADVLLLQNGQVLADTFTDSSGHYSFAIQVTGAYDLLPTDDNISFTPVTGINVSAANPAVTENFTAGQLSLNGVVTDGVSAAPIAGATVLVLQLIGATYSTPVASTTTASDGSYLVPGLAAGDYAIQVNAATYGGFTSQVTLPDPDVALFGFTNLTGVVHQRPDQHAVEGATVRLIDVSGKQVGDSVKTNGNGEFTIYNVTPSLLDYTLIVEAPGTPQVSGPVRVIANQSIDVGTIVLDPAAQQGVSGTVSSDALESIADIGFIGTAEGALVTVIDKNGVPCKSTTVQANGTYIILGLASGTYTITVQKGNATPKSDTITVKDGEITTYNTKLSFVAPERYQPILDLVKAGIEKYNEINSALFGAITKYFSDAKRLDGDPETLPIPEQIPAACRLFLAAAKTEKKASDDAFNDWLNIGGPGSNALGLVEKALNAFITGGKIVAAIAPFSAQAKAAIDIVNAAMNLPAAKLKAFLKLKDEITNTTLVIDVIKAGKDAYGAVTKMNEADKDLNAAANGIGTLASDITKVIQDIATLKKNLELIPGINDLKGFFGPLFSAIDAVTSAFETYRSNVKIGQDLIDQMQAHDLAKARYLRLAPNTVYDVALLNWCVLKATGLPQYDVPPPPPPDRKGGGTGNSGAGAPQDPNDMVGPAGYGAQGYVQPGVFSYRVDFENDPKHATAAAQIVTTTLTLDPHLDQANFQFTTFGFGHFNFTVPAGLNHYETTLDLRSSGINLLVPVTLDENPTTGAVTVEFQSLDPTTLQAPDGLDDGFLPVDNAQGDGEGYFTYTVQPKAGVATGATINAQASIVFDTNDPLATPTATNTIDNGAPTSTVTALPNISPATFNIAWSGNDDANGSGIASYSIYVSDNGGPATQFLQALANQTSASFAGQPGHNYAFYSVASDNVGNVQAIPLSAQAMTTVGQAPTITSANTTSFAVGVATSFPVTAAGFPAATIAENGALPTGLQFANGALSGTPAAGTAGVYTLTFKASNGIGADFSQSFTLTVGVPPSITSANKVTFSVGAKNSFMATATGSTPITWTESGALPAGITFNAALGILTGTAASGSMAVYPVTITASNGFGTAATQNFTLTVAQGKRAPAINSPNNTTFTVGQAGSFTVTTTGSPTVTLTEAGALPVGVRFVNGVLSGTPAPGTGRKYTLTISASNGVGLKVSQVFTLTVNQAPAITSANKATFTVGRLASALTAFTVKTTGFPAPTLTLVVNTAGGKLPAGLSFNKATGVLNGTPAAGTGGVYPITITASNGVGTPVSQNFTLTVNQAPAFAKTNPISATFTVGTAASIPEPATGFPALTYSEIGLLPKGVSFVNGVLSGTPAPGTGGSYPVTLVASNAVGAAKLPFVLKVLQPPAITSLNNATFLVGRVGPAFTVKTTGYTAPHLTLVVNTTSGKLPAGITFKDNGNGTATISGLPAAGTGAVYPLTITASNQVGANFMQSFTLTVNEAPRITGITSTTFTKGVEVLAAQVTAAGFPQSTFMVVSGKLPTGLNLSPSGAITGTPTEAGTFSATIKATSMTSGFATSSKAFTFTVNQAAPAVAHARALPTSSLDDVVELMALALSQWK